MTIITFTTHAATFLLGGAVGIVIAALARAGHSDDPLMNLEPWQPDQHEDPHLSGHGELIEPPRLQLLPYEVLVLRDIAGQTATFGPRRASWNAAREILRDFGLLDGDTITDEGRDVLRRLEEL